MKTKITAHIIRLADAAALRAAWVDLADRSLDPNVFFDPDFIGAATAVKSAGSISLLCLWDGAPGTGRLLGLLPLTFPVPATQLLAHGWRFAHAVSGVPLIDAERADEVIDALLDWLDDNVDGVGALTLGLVPLGSQTLMRIQSRIAADGRQSRLFNQHSRGVLRPGGPEFDSKRRRELRRLIRKLEELGSVAHVIETRGEGLKGSFASHLDLEKRSWKGRMGTAMANDPDVEAFAWAAVEQLAARGMARIDQLRLDGVAIASVIMLGDNRCQSYWKTTFDERHANLGPGRQLEYLVALDLQKDPTILSIDSCEAPNHAGGLGSLWGTMDRFGDLFIGGSGSPSRLAYAAEVLRRLQVRFRVRLTRALKKSARGKG